VPAPYWSAEQTFVSLQKTLSTLAEEFIKDAKEEAAERTRLKQLANIDLQKDLKQSTTIISADELRALNLLETILSLRRSELTHVDTVLHKTRKSSQGIPTYHVQHAELIRKEMETITTQINSIRRDVKIRRDKTTQESSMDQMGTKTSITSSKEHRLKNLVDMTTIELHQQQMRDLRQRIEISKKPQEKKRLRGQLAELYQRHQTHDTDKLRRQGVYRALKGETPQQIADLLKIDVNKLLVANMANRADLTPWTKLEQGSPLLVPRLLLRQAQQRLKKYSEQAQEAQNNTQQLDADLHSKLLKAVAVHDYKQAANLANQLHSDTPTDTTTDHPSRNSHGVESTEKRTPKVTIENKVHKKRRGSGRRKTSTVAKNSIVHNDIVSENAKVLSLLIGCAACKSPIRVEGVHRDHTLQHAVDMAVKRGLPSGYNAIVFKGKILSLQKSLAELSISKQDSRNVKMTAMQMHTKQKGPDPLHQRE
jgi:hypothetical protein